MTTPTHGREWRIKMLENITAPLHGTQQCELVSMFQTSTRWQSLGNARDAAILAAKKICQIVRSGFTLNIRTEREHNLDFLRGFMNAPKEGRNAEILGCYAIQRRKFATKAMITTLKCPGTLERKHVGRLLDHTKQPVITLRVITKTATRMRSKKSAHRTRTDGFMSQMKCARQRGRISLRALQKPNCYALSTPRANAGQTLELSNQ
jgi:hypothetical protein